jgi:hypothetical protein
MIVIAEKYGQLGNRLFVFAHILACALEHGLKVSNPAFDEYAQFFESTRRDLFCRHPPRVSILKGRRLRTWFYTLTWRVANSLFYRSPDNSFWKVIRISEDESCDLADPKFLAAAKAKWFIFVQGWKFRDEPRLQKHADAIRKFFAPTEAVAQKVKSHIDTLRAECEVLVGVHIRQGDYRNFEGGRYFYESRDYARMMKEVEEFFPDERVGFLICSNAAQNPEIFADFKCAPGPGHFVEDMYALAGCDYIMGPPSTYTLWASFYGNVPLYQVKDASRSLSAADFVGLRACDINENVEGSAAAFVLPQE